MRCRVFNLSSFCFTLSSSLENSLRFVFLFLFFCFIVVLLFDASRGFLHCEAMPHSKIFDGCESAFLLEIGSMAVVKTKIIKEKC